LCNIYPLEKEKRLIERVRLGDKTGARQILNELLGSVFLSPDGKSDILKARLLELSVILSRAAVEGGASLEELLGMNYEYIQELAHIEDEEELCAWIVKVMESFISSVYRTRHRESRQVIKEALKYIADHYSEKLTLEEVAEVIDLSPYYFSHLIKEELGMTFVDYLTRVRIEVAKNLLRNTKRKLTQIAFDVGYGDQSYFSKVFKKREGITPSQYRRAYKGRKNESIGVCYLNDETFSILSQYIT